LLSFASSHLPCCKKNFFFSFLFSKNSLLIALSYGITNLAFNWAIAEGDVVRVVFLFYLMPIWASIFAVILIKEMPTFISFIAIAIAIAGAFLILIYDPSSVTFVSVDNFLSIGKEDFLAIIGGMFFGLGNVLIRKTTRINSLLKTFAIFFGTFLVAAVFLLINYVLNSTAKFATLNTIKPELFTDFKFLVIFFSFVIGLGLANFLLQLGASKLPVYITSILLMFEILVAMISTNILQESPLQFYEFIGGILVLVAASLMILNTAKKA
jgi:drug/metabolite transporter (DMT)-like permease